MVGFCKRVIDPHLVAMRSGWTFKQTGFTFGHKGHPPVAPIGGCPQGAEPYFCDHERATVRNLLVRELKHTRSVDPMPGLRQSEQNIEYFYIIGVAAVIVVVAGFLGLHL